LPANTPISNHLYSEIEIGQSISTERTISAADIQLFAALSGDLNPVHIDADYAATTAYGEPIAHGMLCGALISAAIAMQLPGPGSVYRSQNIKFSKPVFVGDRLTITISVSDKNDRSQLVTLGCRATNQDGKIVARGEACVIAPSEKAQFNQPQEAAITLGGQAYRRD